MFVLFERKNVFFDVFGVQGNDRIWTWADTWRSSPEHVYLFKLRWSSLVRNQSRFKEIMTFGRWCYGYGMVHMGIANCANKTHFWFLLSLLHWGLLNILGISRKVCRNLRENPKEKKIQINLKNKKHKLLIAIKHKTQIRAKIEHLATHEKKLVNVIQCKSIS